MKFVWVIVAAPSRHWRWRMCPRRKAAPHSEAVFIDRYLTGVSKADPFIQLIADDLDGLRYLTTDVGRHPRDP